MYTPSAFAVDDTETLYDFIEQHSFGTLITSTTDAPLVSHLPFLLDRKRHTLIGHLAAANPHVHAAADQMVLAVFTGPHCYISPTWYEADHTVPTWNYTAVHITGRLQTITDPDQLLELLASTVQTYETGLNPPWSMEAEDPQFMRRLLAGIVGFEIEIERLEGKWKLNQNHDSERRLKVAERLQQHGGHQQLAIAQLIRDSLTAESAD